MPSLAATYYYNASVLAEVAEFLRGRWVAVHCERRMKDGRPLLVRYWEGEPLKVGSKEDLARLYAQLRRLKPRAFYGTANIYRKLDSREDALDYTGNVALRTLTWDIDSTPEHWRATIEVARAIVGELEKEGVVKSVWLKWSGRGMHVHVHERAIPEDFLAQKGVLDATWSAVQLVLEKVRDRVQSINAKYGSKIKVENLMDPQRVFTAPLSLHRELDAVCVALKPEDLDDFEPSWTNPSSFKHNPRWREFEDGEAVSLAEKALRKVGGYLRKNRQGAAAGIAVQAVPARPGAVFREGLTLSSLRLKERPGPLYRRRLLYNPRLAVEFLEDILSHYVLGDITREEVISLVSSTLNVTLLTQGYAPEDLEKLQDLYGQALQILRAARSPEDVKRALSGPREQ
ncbi:hypothetical protein IG193_00300 [Infirmifilum lucidum]|uniref:DNA primase small subunit n=1 Tax=Infirmifilum lucidum TaxID=2776706 RepID=A0A7L9FHV3_9CREN|nr:hypothetical protein [Infirmifilum lucidum]QOJ78942.1 hypothetical protein IG193_00300 [Infirmifilum lucidum]